MGAKATASVLHGLNIFCRDASETPAIQLEKLLGLIAFVKHSISLIEFIRTTGSDRVQALMGEATTFQKIVSFLFL